MTADFIGGCRVFIIFESKLVKLIHEKINLAKHTLKKNSGNWAPLFFIYMMLIIIIYVNDCMIWNNYILDRDIGGCQTSRRLRNYLTNMQKWFGFKRRGNSPKETFSIFNRRIIWVLHVIEHVWKLSKTAIIISKPDSNHSMWNRENEQEMLKSKQFPK